MSQKFFKLMLFWAVILCGVSCYLPEGSAAGTGTDAAADTGTLILRLPGTKAAGDGRAGPSRSVLSDDFIGDLIYRVTLIHEGRGVVSLETAGGGTTISLKEGVWTITVEAYIIDSTDPEGPQEITVGSSSGSDTVTITEGQTASATISMTVDPDYESTLLDYYIHNEAELRRIGAAENGLPIDSTRTFYLVNNIVLEEAWTPIGSNNTPFEAAFNGQGKTITVKSFTGPVGGGLGFFAAVQDTVIKNTTITYDLGGPVDASTDNSAEVVWGGGIAGDARNTSFENVRVSGEFSVLFSDGLTGGVGGIAGYVEEGTFTNCHVTGTVGGESDGSVIIGGIAGSLFGADSANKMAVSGSSFTGVISGAASGESFAKAGGIAGEISFVEITACFAEGSITAEGISLSSAGGIAGSVYDSAITKSYAAGIIESSATAASPSESKAYAGGIAGNGGDGGAIEVIENCYAWAEVSTSSGMDEYAGGIGGGYLDISKSYAAGTVKSKGEERNLVNIGGILAVFGTVDGCMALVSELDGGASTVEGTLIYKIGNVTVETGNYARNDTLIYSTPPNNVSDPGLMGADGLSKDLEDFTSQTVYETAGWNFTAGSADWKFLGSDYNYPVLSWQTEAPGVTLDEAIKGSLDVTIEWP